MARRPVRRPLVVLAALAVGALTGLPGVAPLAPAGATETLPGPDPADTCPVVAVDDLDAGLVRELGAMADDVFIGDVDSRRGVDAVGGGAGQAETARPDDRGGDDPRRAAPTAYEHVVTVMPVFTGDLDPGRKVVVVTETEAEDGLGPLTPGQQYLFFTTDVETGSASLSDADDKATDGERPRLDAAACAGTTRLPRGFSADLRRELDGILDQGAPVPAAPPAFTEPEGGSGEPPSLGRAVAPGVALGLVGVLGLLLLSRVGRRSS